MGSENPDWVQLDEHVVFEPLSPDVQAPSRATSQSAGYDVRAHLTRGAVRVWPASAAEPVKIEPAEPPKSEAVAVEIVLQPGDRALIPTGFRARLPDGYEAQIRIRSSMAWKRGLTVPNAPGTVDADYPDEWFVLVLNSSDRPQKIGHGERIAQVVLNRFETADWTEGSVARSTERDGGLGSTGT
ncbi:MAG: dUTP diphosphatase [Gemmatimonadota bacterium]